MRRKAEPINQSIGVAADGARLRIDDRAARDDRRGRRQQPPARVLYRREHALAEQLVVDYLADEHVRPPAERRGVEL
eukprot:7210363-Prymnesium_polylepis.1